MPNPNDQALIPNPQAPPSGTRPVRGMLFKSFSFDHYGRVATKFGGLGTNLARRTGLRLNRKSYGPTTCSRPYGAGPAARSKEAGTVCGTAATMLRPGTVVITAFLFFNPLFEI